MQRFLAEFRDTITCGPTFVPIFVLVGFVTFFAIIASSKESLHAFDDIKMVSMFIHVNLSWLFFSRINDGVKVFRANYFDLNTQQFFGSFDILQCKPLLVIFPKPLA